MDLSEESGGHGQDADGAGGQPVGTLRGAGVQVDTARAARIAVAVALVVLVAVGSVLLVAGYRKNAQIDDLKTSGVPVQVTVTRCLALIGGTGQSPAGYECTGGYTYQGRSYSEGLPGNANLPVGTKVSGVVSSGDPGLLSTASTVAGEHTSATVYVLPALLLGSAAVIVVWVVLRGRARRAP